MKKFSEINTSKCQNMVSKKTLKISGTKCELRDHPSTHIRNIQTYHTSLPFIRHTKQTSEKN